jgi:hypothetical protein
VTVSDRERDYMRRIGQIKASLREEEIARHRSLPIHERLAHSWSLYLAYRDRLPSEHDDPTPFYERARALGLYLA